MQGIQPNVQMYREIQPFGNPVGERVPYVLINSRRVPLIETMFFYDFDMTWRAQENGYYSPYVSKTCPDHVTKLYRIANAVLATTRGEIKKKFGEPLLVLCKFLESVRSEKNDKIIESLAREILSSGELIKSNYREGIVTDFLNLTTWPFYQQLKEIDSSLSEKLVTLGILLTPMKTESRSQNPLVACLQEIKNLTDDSEFQEAVRSAISQSFTPRLYTYTRTTSERDSETRANPPSFLSSCRWIGSGAIAAANSVRAFATALWQTGLYSDR